MARHSVTIVLDDGRIAYDLRRPSSDGTHGIVLQPLDFLAELAALVLPPRAHVVTYHGVLAPAPRSPRASTPPAPAHVPAMDQGAPMCG